MVFSSSEVKRQLSGMGWGAQKKMQKIGSMKVIHVCAAVMEVFEMTGFADIFDIE